MKSILESKIDEIAKKLEDILKAVNILQDSILQLSTFLESTSTRMSERELLSTLTTEMSEKLEKFRKESIKDCNIKDLCARRMEKISFRVIQTIAKNGVEESLKEIRKHLEAVGKYRDVCKDENCLKKVEETLRNLEKILEGSIDNKKVNSAKEVIQNLNVSEINEEVAERLFSVSNPIRVKILKALAKGKKSFAEIERITGVKGGHLQFHLRTLIKANYVCKEEKGGKYIITNDALKILKLLCQL